MPSLGKVRVWISCQKFTVGVKTNTRGIIVDAAPIVKKFIGQHINNLRQWMNQFGDFKEDNY